MTRLSDIPVAPELIACARKGDEPARAQLYAALAPGAFGLIRRLIGSRALAEDVFQETMMVFFERLGQFRGEAPLGAWLRQIAVSRALMVLRSPWQRARRDIGLAGDEFDAAPQSPGCPGEQLDLERALASLTSTARAVVWLYEVEGYSHEEIAALFGRSVSFSKSQLARAHQRLRAWFQLQDLSPCTPS
ncbi:MAG TPA: sigma-70 family RNA polymerase sigma factor [Steroidobacteraceae bacterium]|nr:sigma-70 family RNA polymerase sigma factor [Steroidobacteraceae bacterium]